MVDFLLKKKQKKNVADIGNCLYFIKRHFFLNLWEELTLLDLDNGLKAESK